MICMHHFILTLVIPLPNKCYDICFRDEGTLMAVGRVCQEKAGGASMLTFNSIAV